jgi:hypothetical protein
MMRLKLLENIKMTNIQSLILKKLPCHEIAYMHSVQTWQKVLLRLVCIRDWELVKFISIEW